ncbi:DUF445 domain-containing protein [Wenjunlia vitaminophila]|uniref:DUF445 domain-containing protein n=1 Tax=Wenjunlia vitaminophila TaxID=76728 RepID=UPI000AD1CE86|nr:DUF445 domain-containing protein [Wenjunlia vitaminophila]
MEPVNQMETQRERLFRSAGVADPGRRPAGERRGARRPPGPDGAPGPGRPNPGRMSEVSESDEVKRRGVRRMKVFATGLLLLATVVFALARWREESGAGAWAGYVAAAAEAGMVGALADWFAVTALFRRPMGLPIPHTAIIPTKKDAFGRTLGEFVGENFLSEDVVRARLRAVGIGGRLGVWLAEPAHTERVTHELATALRGALAVLRDSDVQAVVGEAVTRQATAQSVAPSLGRMLNKVVTDGGHHRAVDLVCVRAHDWLVEHRASVMAAVTEGAPGWTPRFVDRRVGERVYKELLRFVTEMRDWPAHPARGALDRFLTDFAGELRSDPDTMARVEQLKADVLARREVQELIESAWSAVRAMVVAAAEDPDSQLRRRARSALGSLGVRMRDDARLQAKVDGWLEDAATYVVTTYRDEITSLITDTVESWDAEHTSRKIEANVGRDLQFIRINGTVVGALAGLLIYTVAHALGG